MADDAFHLTALDVRRYDFGNALRGYDRARVDQFREQVADELERLGRVTQELEAKARNFHEQLRAFRERDKALNEALVSAQQLRGEIRGQAEKEGQLVLREARAEADKIVEGARAQARQMDGELQALWRSRRTYLAQVRALIERQTAELEAAEAALPPEGIAGGSARVVASPPAPAPVDVPRPSPREALEAIAEVRPAMPTPSWLDALPPLEADDTLDADGGDASPGSRA
ncbi:MAG: DivIVA domain-containing protein [Gemmatimonadaceae bacterium]|jgi:DivIVA domain-containing protein|nr:DivIVA domain-containing protein [Gemmatimonadaceae bacterium]